MPIVGPGRAFNTLALASPTLVRNLRADLVALIPAPPRQRGMSAGNEAGPANLRYEALPKVAQVFRCEVGSA